MDTTVLQLDPTPQNGRYSGDAFITLKDGRILYAYTKYLTSSNHDDSPGLITSRVSADGGRTWSEDDRVLIERGAAQNVMAVSLLRLHSGRILVLYCQKDFVAEGVSCTPFIRFSDDEMETLSEPVKMVDMQEYHCVNNDRVIQLESGRLVVPVAQHRRNKGFSNPGLIFYLLSDDDGQTWTESKSSHYRCFPDGHGWQEPGAIELKDGRLWAWMRTGWNGGEKCGRQWESFSDDRGETWSEPQASQFVSPYSPLSMKRVPGTGDLFAVWNDHSGRFPTPCYGPKTWECNEWERYRTPLSCAISRDEGRIWEHHLLLEDAPDHGFCYTAIHFVEDAVLLAYSAGGASTKTAIDRLRLRRVPLSTIYGIAAD